MQLAKAVGVNQSSVVKFCQKQFLESLNKKDVLILLSVTDELELKPLMLSELRAKEVKIILICPYSHNSSHHLSDIVLSTISDSNGSRNEICTSCRAAQQHIVDILLSLSESKAQY